MTLSASAANVTVFAAASLTDSLRELAGSYEKRTGDKVVLNLAASSTLARQIEEGAPAEIFLSADEAKMDRLEQQGLIVNGTRRRRLSNSLVAVIADEGGVAVRSAADLLKPEVKRVALGEPRTVPAGIYAREYLEKLGLWKAVQPKVVATENVRAALAAVEAGDADVSLVYRTDALLSKRVKVAFEVPVTEGPAISYPMALVKGAGKPAERFLEYLGSEAAARVFEKYGFRIISGPAHAHALPGAARFATGTPG